MRLMSAIFGKILLMPHAASHRPNIDQVRSAVASMGGASPVLELLLAELEATREERDSLRKEKHSNTLGNRAAVATAGKVQASAVWPQIRKAPAPDRAART